MSDEKVLTVEVWERLIESGHTVSSHLGGFVTIDDAAAEKMSTYQDGDLYLDGLISLSDAAAACLSGFKGYTLSLGGLTSLSDAAVESLSSFKGYTLSLDGLTSLSDAAAESLSGFKGNNLSLDGLTSLSDAAAESLRSFDGYDLSLDGLISLSDAAARSLSTLEPDTLSLNGLTEISDVAAEILNNYDPDLLPSNSDAPLDSAEVNSGETSSDSTHLNELHDGEAEIPDQDQEVHLAVDFDRLQALISDTDHLEITYPQDPENGEYGDPNSDHEIRYCSEEAEAAILDFLKSSGLYPHSYIDDSTPPEFIDCIKATKWALDPVAHYGIKEGEPWEPVFTVEPARDLDSFLTSIKYWERQVLDEAISSARKYVEDWKPDAEKRETEDYSPSPFVNPMLWAELVRRHAMIVMIKKMVNFVRKTRDS